MIAVGCDHIGYELKIPIIEYLQKKGIEVYDFGCHDTNRTDYPVFAFKVACAVARGEYEKGLLFCGTGIGISIAANKVEGVRCVVCSEPYSALLSRQHNDTNILSLGARVVGVELAKMIVDAWLEGKFEGGRHLERIEMISKIEHKSFDRWIENE